MKDKHEQMTNYGPKIWAPLDMGFTSRYRVRPSSELWQFFKRNWLEWIYATDWLEWRFSLSIYIFINLGWPVLVRISSRGRNSSMKGRGGLPHSVYGCEMQIFVRSFIGQNTNMPVLKTRVSLKALHHPRHFYIGVPSPRKEGFWVAYLHHQYSVKVNEW